MRDIGYAALSTNKQCKHTGRQTYTQTPRLLPKCLIFPKQKKTIKFHQSQTYLGIIFKSIFQMNSQRGSEEIKQIEMDKKVVYETDTAQ